MTPARKAILAEAEDEAKILRRCGYPDAVVLPQYCIGGEIDGSIMTKTICIDVGEYKPQSMPLWMQALTARRKGRKA